MSGSGGAKKWIEDKEKALAKSVIKWKLSKEAGNIPGDNILDEQSEIVVKEANRIVKNSGKKILTDVKSGLGKVFNK